MRLLVVLHTNHTNRDRLCARDASIVDRWRSEGVLYTSPHGMNDDWYWLHAAVSSGEGCKVISNDEMRDHHFAMLWPPAFVRWKERHVLHFEFPHSLLGGSDPPPLLIEPRPYSHAMQEDAAAGGVWHIPVQSEMNDAWISVRPPRANPGQAQAQALGRDW